MIPPRLLTPRAVFDTVIYDDQTRLWFDRLFVSAGVIKRFRDGAGIDAGLYRRFWLFSRLTFFSALCVLILVVAGLFLGASYRPAGFILAGCAGIAFAAFLIFRRRSLAALAARMVEQDLPSFPVNITLYQLGEIYAREYHLPSLVDMVWRWDSWMRGTVILVYFAAFGVYFLSLPWMFFWTAAGCYFFLFVFRLMFMRQTDLEFKLER